MKRNWFLKLISALVFSGFIFSAQAADTFKLDPMHSYVLWYIDHFGFSTQVGKWLASGTLILDNNHPENDKLEASVQVANVVTGIDELNKHLQSKLFFDVAQFPVATFKSDSVKMTSKTTARVQGMLTLHGVTKSVTLDVTLLKEGENPVTNKYTAGFRASTTLKRSDFGISALLPGLGDSVKITIGAEANKVEAK